MHIRNRKIIKIEKVLITKTNDEYSFPVLWDKRLGINYACLNIVIQFFPQGSHDNLKCIAFIVAYKIFDILKQERARPMVFDETRYIEKQRTLCVTAKAVSTAERVFLGDTCYRKGLTRKPCQQEIMIWNITGFYLGYIAINIVTVIRIICTICLNCIFVPLTGEYAFTSQRFKSAAQPTDTSKKINKPEFRIYFGNVTRFNYVFKVMNNGWSRFRISIFPSI